jgi:IS5 family transposase
VESGRGEELREMSHILDIATGMRAVYEQAAKDLNCQEEGKARGRHGISVERVIKLGILRKRYGMTYRELSDMTEDSLAVRQFLDLRYGEHYSRAAIQSNVKMISEEVWEALSDSLVLYAQEQRYENGKKLRTDTTTVESNIHYPTDSSLLNDCVRVLCREMGRAKEIVTGVTFTDSRRRAKKKLFLINNTRGDDKRQPLYVELIRVTRRVVKEAEAMLPVLKKFACVDMKQMLMLARCETMLRMYIPRATQVVSQAHRRVVKKEVVPAAEKIVSIFEEHTDIIVKGLRDVVFGHKILLSTGSSSLILGMEVLEGNPKDSTLVPQVIREQQRLFGKAPEMMVFDGCFASRENRDELKSAGVKDLTFCKNLGMSLDSLVSSQTIHKMLGRFRAGIEGSISFLKRIFSFDRVLDKGKKIFHAALHMGIAAYNLTLIARFNIVRRQLQLQC